MKRKLLKGVLAGVAFVTVATVAVVVAPSVAEAKAKTHRDDVRGFQCRVEDSWEQVPPKPGTDDLHIAAEWKDPSAKYRRFTGDQPTFRIIWTVTPKGDAPPEEGKLPDWAKDLPEEQQKLIRQMQGGTKETLEGEVNGMLERNDRLFGTYKPLAEYYAERKKPKIIKTKDGLEVDVLEINYHKKRPKDPEPNWWMWVGRTSWETETEKIELGFYGYVDVQFAKKFRKQFVTAVRTFKRREIEDPTTTATDEGGEQISQAEKDIQEFIRTKIIKGWKYERTKHYLVVYDEDVDKGIVNRVTKEIEALREQVYEVVFPPDHPVEAISIVRICESRIQYRAYGAPGGSAGYWSPYHKELVLYQDKGEKKDAIRVLYHEAFHQYIFYSVGEVSPHSWFNEGHGDFFSGHVYKRGKFKLAPFGWRTEKARKTKARWKKGIFRVRGKGKPGATSDGSGDGKTAAPAPGESEPERLTLAEWLTWRQPQYYGSNDFGVEQGENYALGWSFIYFLRTTKNEAYRMILPNYFNTLKSFVTQAREKALEDGFGGGKPGEDGEDGGDDGEGGTNGKPGEGDGAAAGAPAKSETTDEISRDQWHGEALKTATRGIDIEQLEKDWLEHKW